MRIQKQHLTMAGLALSLAGLSGCFFASEEKASTTPEDKRESQKATTEGTVHLEATVARMRDVDQFEYGKEDLTDLKRAHAGYQAALILDPGNNQARLGSAIAKVMLAAQSKRLSGVINQSLDAKSPFDPALVEDAPLARMGVIKKVAAAAEFPEFHEIQDAIADSLLPALEEALVLLKAVYDDPAFTMTFTSEGAVRELDHAEAGALLAGFHAVHALVTLWLSYDIDIDDNGSYDYIRTLAEIGEIDDFALLTDEQRQAFNTLTHLLTPGSTFLAVKPAWLAKLRGVDDEIRTALGILKEAALSIPNETDVQTDDVLRLCSATIVDECIDSDDFDQGVAYVDSGIKYMNQPYDFEVPKINETVSFNFSAYFGIEDFKKLLPWYGFYNAAEWSEEKPVVFFTDASGAKTGDIRTVIDIGKEADSLGTPPAEVVAKLKVIIHFQDPTFQGFLPGMTEARIWDLITKLAEAEEQAPPVVINDGGEVDYGLPKGGVVSRVLSPGLALSLAGE